MLEDATVALDVALVRDLIKILQKEREEGDVKFSVHNLLSNAPMIKDAEIAQGIIGLIGKKYSNGRDFFGPEEIIGALEVMTAVAEDESSIDAVIGEIDRQYAYNQHFKDACVTPLMIKCLAQIGVKAAKNEVWFKYQILDIVCDIFNKKPEFQQRFATPQMVDVLLQMVVFAIRNENKTAIFNSVLAIVKLSKHPEAKPYFATPQMADALLRMVTVATESKDQTLVANTTSAITIIAKNHDAQEHFATKQMADALLAMANVAIEGKNQVVINNIACTIDLISEQPEAQEHFVTPKMLEALMADGGGVER